MDDWVPFDDLLANRGFRVIKFDNRDIGLSQRFDEKFPEGSAPSDFPYTINDMADDAAAVLDHYGISKAHVVGASMGGLITQVMGTRHPERCITLTPIMTFNSNLKKLSATAQAKDNRETMNRFGKIPPLNEGMTLEEYSNCKLIAAEIIGVDPVYPELSNESRERIKQTCSATYKRNGVDWGGHGTQRQVMAMMAWDERGELEPHTTKLESMAIPTLVLHGLYDKLIPIEYGRQLADRIPESRFVEYVGNHTLGNHPDVRDFVLATIVDHLRSYE